MTEPPSLCDDSRQVAALFVQREGAYWTLPNVEPWDEERDARLYDGPWPVVAHPGTGAHLASHHREKRDAVYEKMRAKLDAEMGR